MLARGLSEVRNRAWALYQRTDGLGSSGLAGLAVGWLARGLRALWEQAWALYQRTDGLGSAGLAGLAGQNAKGPMVPSLGPISNN